MKSLSPVHSLDNRANDNEREVLYHGSNRRRPIRARISDGVMLSGPSAHTEIRWCEEDGVKVWLNSLGLGQYAPVFKIHEVDDEILPLLTIEDLKDMGINAVGSRRKMFCAIQMLGKGFS
ncbi:serine carboxypeptidase-like 45-like [Hibiscus syriacus]|uniref:Serine carboxypeptidase-like 45-like n=1 Tax=Hibiscus syriacus TaxID=106335 RepID=A0A6A2WNG2_HIBSY|nr:serine carboxypeptidase-like 45-like [Hibiscus syriacus]